MAPSFFFLSRITTGRVGFGERNQFPFNRRFWRRGTIGLQAGRGPVESLHEVRQCAGATDPEHVELPPPARSVFGPQTVSPPKLSAEQNETRVGRLGWELESQSRLSFRDELGCEFFFFRLAPRATHEAKWNVDLRGST